ncbi:tRNA threonylcarbamoyladenosine dehydratase [Candidimonas nitroreducens]|uniref:tRNA threonylcarbamoyladenosine dehydratase n=2 Tax=Candidimonas nitroreducens TaxID=683354 RepID=A0A225MQC5_9BURK|nr:tRNA threonylcarbamoyladenosine dehydratase [Candidimonas nitroreducens]OWT62130.1 tRNA threonylcarbamoyladenosine dehydratase [Candidimonas nitroreducens]
MSEIDAVDTRRRFGGVERLYGPDALPRLAAAHVAVAGIGGVGSWCAEALARCGVGALTLIDLDHIAESNINRQLHALTETLGAAKVQAMAQRVHGINPDCRVNIVDDFVTPDNIREVLPPDLAFLVDCTDQISAKTAMILEMARRAAPIVVCGGAGGKIDALGLRAGDLAQAANDALLAKLRNTLRRRHGYPKASDHAGKPRKRVPKMGVRALWFDQPALLPSAWASGAAAAFTAATGSSADSAAPSNADAAPDTSAAAAGPQGLSCAGYGSLVTVTAAMGMAAAGQVIHHLIQGRYPG